MAARGQRKRGSRALPLSSEGSYDSEVVATGVTRSIPMRVWAGG